MLGLVAGSFIATLVMRLPADLPITGRSRCDSCRAGVRARDLWPLLSFAVLRGRCRACGARIDPRHPAIEAVAAVIGVTALVVAPGAQGFALALFGWALLAAGAIDADHFWLPHALTVPLLAGGLAFGLPPFAERALGAGLGAGALAVVAAGYRAWRGRDGLGGGDVVLFAGVGAWLGGWWLAPVMLGASLLGLGSVAARVLGGRPAPERLPLGALIAAVAFPLALAAYAFEGSGAGWELTR